GPRPSRAPTTAELIENLFEVRRLPERAGAARAEERADAALVRRLRAVTAFEYRSEDAARFKSATDANAEFHLEVCRASGNALFLDLVRHCLDQVTRLIALAVDYEPLQEPASDQHRRVVDAIQNRAPAVAQAAMEAHPAGTHA